MNKQAKMILQFMSCVMILNSISCFSQSSTDSLSIINFREITKTVENGISNGRTNENVLLMLGNDCLSFNDFKAKKQNIPALGSGKILKIDFVKGEVADKLSVCSGKSIKEGIYFVMFCTDKTRKCLSEAEMQKIISENKRNRVMINDSSTYPVVTLTDKYNVMKEGVDHSSLNIKLKPTSGLIIDVSKIDMITNVYKKMDIYKLSVRVEPYEAEVKVNNENRIIVHAWQLIDKRTGKEFHGFTDRVQPVFLDIINSNSRSTQGMYMFISNLEE